jgi:signal transduction histidine kinase
MGKIKLLVIDDEIGICEGIQRVLEPEGFQVEIALDGRTALEMIRKNGFDLILIDVKMPQISGLDLIPMIHKLDPEIICIIITGYATVEMAVSAIKQGAYDFLTKPFTLDTLLLAVNQGLERRALSLESKKAALLEDQANKLAEEKERLEKLDQAKRQFIRLITHELKSPVSAIENYLKLILGGFINPEDQKKILEQCITRTQEERKMIDDLLELGHLEVLESFQKTPVDMGEVLQHTLGEFEEEIHHKNLDLKLKVQAEIPTIMAAPEQIKSIWRNLISNAIKYSPQGGDISIFLTYQDGMIIGQVQDHGIGITQEDQSNLFAEFFRAKNAKNTGIPGTGLGLVIIKRILEGMGGEISVVSKLNSGSTFKFWIPVEKDMVKFQDSANGDSNIVENIAVHHS